LPVQSVLSGRLGDWPADRHNGQNGADI